MFLTPLRPTFEAALRDVRAQKAQARMAAAGRLSEASGNEVEPAAAGLTVLLKDAMGPIRAAAVEGLGQLRAGEEAIDRILALVSDPDFNVRQGALWAASRIAPERAQGTVRSALDDARPEMRHAAAGCMIETYPEEAATALPPLLSDGDPEVRFVAARGLGELAVREAADALAARLGDEVRDVAIAAAVALCTIGDRRGAKLACEALGDRAWALGAADALGTLGDPSAREPLAALADRFLVPLIVRTAAAGALVKLGDPRGVEGLRRVLRALRSDGRSYATELAGELGVVELVPELDRLVRRPRGVEPDVLEAALDKLAEKSADAAAALQRLRTGRAGAPSLAR